MKKPYELRDQWLKAATTSLRKQFKQHGYAVPDDIRISVGFPGGRGGASGSQHIGMCWYGEGIQDGVDQVYISPVLGDPVRVLDVLVHELCHAAVGIGHGHKGPFRTLATAMGLEGKMTATIAGDDLAVSLTALAKRLGPYPHSALDMSKRKKQTTRMIKAICEDDQYIVRLSRKMLTEHGAPICPTCQAQMTSDGGDDDE